MKPQSLLWIPIVSALLYYVGCAPAEFSKDLSCGPDCIIINSRKAYKYEIIPNHGKVDILFVNDNSASMSPEQRQMAARFETFISELDRRNVDYRIAVTTTDVSDSANPPRTINQNGALQDGRLIPFAPGQYYIAKENTTDTHSRIAAFRQLIERRETLQCENYLFHGGIGSYFDNCPSPDERGLLAAYRSLARNDAQFIRPDAHLAVVILSDEDVRSGMYRTSQTYALADEDHGSMLVGLVTSKWPNKSMRIHAIVVKPGDQGCLNIQNNQINGVKGSEGHVYAEAARSTGGILGDVCASDYGSQLHDIASNIGEALYEHTLRCDKPDVIDADTVPVVFVPASAAGSWEVVGNKIRFNPRIRPGTKVQLQYSCPE